MVKGIDISKYQAGINLSAVKNAGMDFVILRAGYTGYGDGVSKAKDTSFETFYTQSKEVGLKVGAYWFTCANTYQKGVDEAKWMYENCLKGKQFEYPIYIDVEDDTGKRYYLRNAGKEATTQGVKGFCETLENLGYYVGIYASDISGFKDLMNIEQLTRYDKWVARYGSKPSYVSEHGMHQYTSSGKINGYSGNLDLNESYKDYPSIIKKGGLNGFGKGQNEILDNIPSNFLPSRGYFKNGDVSENVGKIASFMYKNFPAYTNKKALGNIYGPYLISSIKEFQRRTNLTPDGCTGPLTLAKLKEYGFSY